MKTDLTYDEAFNKLEQLVGQLEEGDIPLDKLSAKVKQANEFIKICDDKLTKIETDVIEIIKATPQTRKKNR
jgi:exodeoxyribonuclease VII small subunit